MKVMLLHLCGCNKKDKWLGMVLLMLEDNDGQQESSRIV